MHAPVGSSTNSHLVACRLYTVGMLIHRPPLGINMLPILRNRNSQSLPYTSAIWRPKKNSSSRGGREFFCPVELVYPPLTRPASPGNSNTVMWARSTSMYALLNLNNTDLFTTISNKSSNPTMREQPPRGYPTRKPGSTISSGQSATQSADADRGGNEGELKAHQERLHQQSHVS